ncbi:MAG: hypothetical protein KatS3mg024_1800 [Armatimonadota bacterium]|nr:MAG: hypothetical protein KatS3mg024_1800 [Armatimonadota bacterium]
MRRVLMVAVVLAAILAQPAGAWIPIGQTADTGGVLLYDPGDGLTASLYDDTTGTSPSFSWYYPSQVDAELGGSYPLLLSIDANPPSWSGGWALSYDSNGLGTLLQGTVTSVTYQEVSPGVVNFAANLFSVGPLHMPDGTQKQLSDYGMTNAFRLTGTLTYNPGVDGGWPDNGQFYQGPMVLSVQPIPEPVFFQMGALMGLSGLGLLRLRRKA